MAEPVNLNTTTLTEGPDTRDEFITNVHAQSGILQLVAPRRISHRGESLPVIPRTTVEEVGETQVKPLTDEPITSLVAKPITLATTVAVSKQLIDNHAGIIAEVAAQGSSDIADGLDARAAGDVLVSGSSFGQLSRAGLEQLPLRSKADWFKAIASISRGYSNTSGVYLSEAAYAELSGMVFSEGANVFNIEGDMKSGFFQGVKYATFKSDKAQVFVGDFARKAVAGTVYDVDVDINPYGGAHGVNFWTQNMIGVRAEGAYAFNFVPSAFRELVLSDAS